MRVIIGFFVILLSSIALAEEELVIERLNENECDIKTKNGDMITVHYTGKLTDGTKFDSSHDRDQPFTFTLGTSQVIKGWDQGLLEMCPGDKRILKVPAHLAYADKGAGAIIPPDAALEFDVELIKREDGPPVVNVFKQIDSDQDMHLSKLEIIEYIHKNVPADAMTGDQSPEKIAEELFHHEDKDRDGLISHEEFSGPKHDEL